MGCQDIIEEINWAASKDFPDTDEDGPFGEIRNVC